jgi:hypothetical protein
MKFLLKFPSRGRPELFKSTFNKWESMLSGKHPYQFLVSLDNDDRSMNNTEMHAFLDAKKNVTYCYGNSKSKVEAINANMECGGEFDCLVLISDDMLPQVSGYDDIIATKMNEHFSELDGCLHFNDGRTGSALNTLSIMGKRMYDHFGYIYHNDYKSLWCDNEFHEATQKLKKYVYIDQVIISHGWHDVTGNDHLARRNDALYHRDEQVFRIRQRAGFPKTSMEHEFAVVDKRERRREKDKERLRRP